MTLYEHLVSPLLRVLDPEQSHTLTMRLLGAAQGVPGVVPVVHRLSEAEDPRMAVSWKGLRFPNPIRRGRRQGCLRPCLACGTRVRVHRGWDRDT